MISEYHASTDAQSGYSLFIGTVLQPMAACLFPYLLFDKNLSPSKHAKVSHLTVGTLNGLKLSMSCGSIGTQTLPVKVKIIMLMVGAS